jgi:hypothetical protein
MILLRMSPVLTGESSDVAGEDDAHEHRLLAANYRQLNVLPREPSRERLLHFETCRTVNSHNSALTAIGALPLERQKQRVLPPFMNSPARNLA